MLHVFMRQKPGLERKKKQQRTKCEKEERMRDTPRSRSQAVASQAQRSSERKTHSSEEGKNSQVDKD